MVLVHLARCERCHVPLAIFVYIDDYHAACDAPPVISRAEKALGVLGVASTLPTYLLTPKTDNGHESLHVHQLWPGPQDSLTVKQLTADLQQQYVCA